MIRHVYIHFPFCLKKCGYCSFISIEWDASEVENYIEHLLSEIGLYSGILELKPETIYFGGGTPSLMSSDHINRIMNLFDLSSLKEATLEVNPATVDKGKLITFRDTSINRLSIGMQSFLDKELQTLGRMHDSRDNYHVYETARELGFDNLSLDIIYGLQSQRESDLQETIKTITRMRPEHISAYCLSLEQETTLYRRGYKLPADEITARFYRCISDNLNEAGYEQYEISNFARKGYMSQHNMAYWLNREYAGFGCSAHGYAQNQRYENPDKMNIYYDNIKNRVTFPNREEQDDAKLKKDFVIQSFRMSRGLDLKQYTERFRGDFLEDYKISIEKHKKFLDIDGNFIKLKPEGYFVSNEILIDFID